jgi:Flp pilus assembly protein TadG
MQNRRRRTFALGGTRGQALAEMAIAVPVMILVALAIFEGGAFALTLTTLENAAQRGGRLAALPSTASETDVQSLVVTEAARAAITLAPGDVVVSCAPSCTYTTRTSGQRVRVTVNFVYQPLTALVFGGSATFPLEAVTEYNVE